MPRTLETRTLTACALALCMNCSQNVPRESRRSNGVTPAEAGAGMSAAGKSGFEPGSGGAGSSSVASTSAGEPAADSGTESNVERTCAGVSAKAETKLLPTDVIWAIDTSGSMALSFPAIQQALDTFSRKIVDAGIDAHIVLLAGATGGALPGTGICVPAPLGSGRCGAGAGPNAPAPDSNEPAFLHLDTPFAANEGVGVLLDHHADFKHLLRRDARTQFVLTEDGAPPVSVQAVVDHVEGRAPASGTTAWSPGLEPGSWVFNAVVCPSGFALGSCLLSGDVPQTTLELVERTGGVLADLNNAGAEGLDPFAELLDQLATNVIAGAQIECSYAIPPAPAGMQFDPAQVNVVYAAPQGPESFPRLAEGASCQRHVAWRYDDPAAPTQVELCPAACDRVRADAAARIDLTFGCETEVLGPE